MSRPVSDPPVGYRERLVAAAAEYAAEHGWGRLTMAKLADLVGVSRQTVYNEVGGKPQLAEAVVLRELDGFLALVDSAFEDHPDDVLLAIETAARRVLEEAAANPLLRAVVSGSQGADSALLPLLTTQSTALLEAAGAVLKDRVRRYEIPLDAGRLDVLVDMVIRLVLSHVIQPSQPPERTAEAIAWLAESVQSR